MIREFKEWNQASKEGLIVTNYGTLNWFIQFLKYYISKVRRSKRTP